MNGEVVSLVAALIQAYAPLGEADEVVLGFFKLERIHIKPLVDLAGIEQECVGRDAEQGLGQLGDAGDGKVLKVLTGEDHAGLLLSDPLHEVSDILDSRQIGEKQIQLVY